MWTVIAQANLDATHLARVVVVGASCSGKSTLARKLAALLGSRYIELDALHWGPGWVAKPDAEFSRLTEAATSEPRWVVDGNYRVVRQIVWPRATAIVWLNLGFTTVLRRAFRRTLRRCLTGEELYAGNRESLRRAFLSHESILLWVIQTHGRRRREFQALKKDPGKLRWIELRHPSEVAAFLGTLEAAA